MQWIDKVRYDVKKAEIDTAYETAKEKGVIYSDTVDGDHETVAWFVEHYLLKNERQVRKLYDTKPTLGRRIINWFDHLLTAMGNRKAENGVAKELANGLSIKIREGYGQVKDILRTIFEEYMENGAVAEKALTMLLKNCLTRATP